MQTRQLAVLLAAATCGVILRVAPAAAQPPSPSPSPPADAADDQSLYSCKKVKGGLITVSLKPETELKDLLVWVSTFTCKAFVYEPGIMQRSKKVTMMTPNKMSPQDAYRVFLVALSTMGVTVVPKGNTLRVVETSQAKGETVAVMKRTPGNTDEIVRFIFRPSYMSADTMANALTVLKSKDGAVNQIGNVVLVTDYASQIRDMVTLGKELDKPSANEGIYTILVQYADAKELQAKLQEILGVGQPGGAGGGVAMGGKGGGGAAAGGGADGGNTATPSKILVDDRTNTLIVVSTEAGYLRVRALVKRLDLPLDTTGSGSIHVYALENATAEEMATTLNNALQGTSQPTGGRPGTGGGGRSAPSTPAPPPVRGDLGAALEGTVRVTHDAPTNSLVVVASGRDFLALKDVIRKLDVPRQQVYLEAVILEVQLGDEFKLGTSSHGGLPFDDGNGIILGGVQTPDLRSTSLTSLLSASGLIGGLIGAPLTESENLLGVSIPSYAVLFQALSTSANTNVLSTPFIMATDNQESEISVGQNIPYQAGLSFGGIGLPGQGGSQLPAGSIGQNIQREKLTLDMKIKPHINQSDMIRLEIEQEIKDIGDKDPQLGPTWTERKVKTQVVVRDQQSIVIGGLMQDRTIYNEAKVPLLGDIPILGYLFKYTSKSKKKTNLLILLTPYVVKDQLDLEEILERKAREKNEFVRAFANLDSTKYLPRVDYRRKRGLVEEINRTIEGIEQDADMLRSLEGNPPPPDGVIDIGPTEPIGEDGATIDNPPSTIDPTTKTSPSSPSTPPSSTTPVPANPK
jgi:general secretion pathway protein D